MSKFLEFGAAGGALVMLTLAYNFGDRFVTPVPTAPDRSEAIAAYTAPPPSPMMAAVAEGHGAGRYGLGRTATPDEIAAWDVNVMPDGRGLPPGSGSVEVGEELFSDNCAVCHGEFAEGVDNWPTLSGGFDTLADEDPVKTVGSYWPYLSTVWDYVHRSMPFGNAQTLEPDQVYAIVAYILYSNDMVDEDFVLSNENFLDVEMANAGGFVTDDRAETEYPLFSAEPCMTDCKASVEITRRASVLDVTPEETRARRVQEMIEATRPGGPAAGSAFSGGGGTTVTTQPEGDGATTPEADTAALETAPAEEPAATPEPAAPDPALVEAGAKVFRKCSACHQVGEGAKNRSGPVLNGVVGRAVAAHEGFRYSGAMKTLAEAGEVWTPERLAEFLANPKADVPGTKMSFRGLSKPEDITAVIAFLASHE